MAERFTESQRRKNKREALLLAELQQRHVEDIEFRALVSELKPKGFTISHQVSNYIVVKKLGEKYKNISGYLEMKSDNKTWTFEGGFSTRIFARLCKALGLKNKNTKSKPGKFKSYKDSK